MEKNGEENKVSTNYISRGNNISRNHTKEKDEEIIFVTKNPSFCRRRWSNKEEEEEAAHLIFVPKNPTRVFFPGIRMTSGSVSIKNFPWALKSKKRHRSGSGGSKDHEAKKKSLLSKRQSKFSQKKMYELLFCS